MSPETIEGVCRGDATVTERLISADSHMCEPPNLWTERIDARFRDRAPCIVKQEVRPTQVTHTQRVRQRQRPRPHALFHAARHDGV